MTRLEIQAAGGDTATPLNLQKRLDWIGAVAGPLRGKSVIDCGCGAGEYVRALTNLGADAWGIEYSAEKIGEAQRLGGCPRGASRSA
jgi:2-polyprenyl-3-methyl-5-hydroxy-6-metoxy-1,4-benzoquinol methylase